MDEVAQAKHNIHELTVTGISSYFSKVVKQVRSQELYCQTKNLEIFLMHCRFSGHLARRDWHDQSSVGFYKITRS